MGCLRPAPICPFRGCWTPTATASSRGSPRASRSSGGARTRAWSCSRPSSTSRARWPSGCGGATTRYEPTRPSREVMRALRRAAQRAVGHLDHAEDDAGLRRAASRRATRIRWRRGSAASWREGSTGWRIGRMFFGESMFARVTDASKVAFVYLVRHLARWGFGMIDCQMKTAHLASFGAREIPRAKFTQRDARIGTLSRVPGPWRLSPMTHLGDFPLSMLQFYATAPYPCSYLPEKMARSQVATPSHLIDTAVYSELVRAGFRRSGAFTYRPYCDHCRACVPVRIVTPGVRAEPGPAPSLEAPRRAHVADSRTAVQPGTLRPVSALPVAAPQRRRDGPGQPRAVSPLPASEQRATRTWWSSGRTAYCAWSSIVDRLQDGISSVYTFFDPTVEGASYGTYNVMWQVELCRKLGLPYLYLGYWIAPEPQDGLQDQFPPDGGPDRRQRAGQRLPLLP